MEICSIASKSLKQRSFLFLFPLCQIRMLNFLYSQNRNGAAEKLQLEFLGKNADLT